MADTNDATKHKDAPESGGKRTVDPDPEAEPAPNSPSPDRESSPARKSEGKSAKPDGGTPSRKKVSKSRKASSKKVHSPSPAPENKKRKHADSESPPSFAGSASVERRKTSRSKSRRRLESIPTMDMDPETKEVLAVAAAAEKEEAAARRTTRLAAGKIGKVDYNVASGVLSKPSSGNADNDESEGEHNSNEQATEEPRKSRRREGSERERHRERQRSSRRQTRKRASREQSPGRATEETRNSKRGTRNGSRSEPRNESRNGDIEANARGPSVSKDDVMDVDTGSGTGSHESDIDPEECEHFSTTNLNEREDEGGWTINGLTEIAKSVHRTGQISGSAIAADLKQEILLSSVGMSEKEIVNKLEEVTDHIKGFHKTMSDISDYSVRVNDVLSFFATDIERLRSGQPRPLYTAQMRLDRSEKRKVIFEKRKRRAKREVDDSMGKLEAELEARRNADLSAAMATMELREMERKHKLMLETRKKLQRQIRYVKAQERDGKKRVERSRRLYVKLVEKAESNDAPKPDLSAAESTTPAAPSTSKKPRQPLAGTSNDSRRTIGESFTSDERRMNVDANPEGQSRPRPATEVESSPPDPRLLSEVERMRGLVSVMAREAAEEQRKAQELYLIFRKRMDAKEKLDEELYINNRSMLQFQGSTARPSVVALRGREDRRAKGGPSKQANGGSKGRGKTGAAGASAGGAKNGGKKARKEDGKSRRKTSKTPAVSA